MVVPIQIIVKLQLIHILQKNCSYAHPGEISNLSPTGPHLSQPFLTFGFFSQQLPPALFKRNATQWRGTPVETQWSKETDKITTNAVGPVPQTNLPFKGLLFTSRNKGNIRVLYCWAYQVTQYMAITIPLTQWIQLIAHLLQASLGETAPLTHQRRSAVSYCIWLTSSEKTVTRRPKVWSLNKNVTCPWCHPEKSWAGIGCPISQRAPAKRWQKS